MRVGVRFRVGPFRFYQSLFSTGGKKLKAPTYTHGTCTIAHRSEGAAQRCRSTT